MGALSHGSRSVAHKLYLLLVAVAAAAFLLFPGLDLTVSGWFYRPETAWALGYNPVFTVIHAAVPDALGVAMLAAAIVFAVNLARGTDVMQLRARGIVFVTLALLLGPGLLANVVLKDHWGRARPAHVSAFGGPSRFTPPLLIADQCDHNCSFVAGDAAAGYFLLAFALLARRRRALALVAADQDANFRARAAALGIAVEALDRRTGYNYSHGRWTTLALYRRAP